MKESTVQAYAAQADWQRAKWARDMHANPTQGTRLERPLTEGWSRYRPHEIRVVVRNSEGRSVSLSPNQHRVLTAVRMAETDDLTMRSIATSLGIAVSSVSRALIVLAAWKLVAYDVVRGRKGGISLVSMTWADLKMRSRTAWQKLHRERQRAWDRYLRKLDATRYWWSGLNVALTSTYERNIYGKGVLS